MFRDKVQNTQHETNRAAWGGRLIEGADQVDVWFRCVERERSTCPGMPDQLWRGAEQRHPTGQFDPHQPKPVLKRKEEPVPLAHLRGVLWVE